MAREELIIGARRTGVGLGRHIGAGEIGAINRLVRPDRDAVTRRRKHETGNVAAEIGDLFGRTAGQRHAPQLIRTRGVAEIIDVPAVGREFGIMLVLVCYGRDCHRLCPARCEIEQIEIGLALVRRQIGFTQLIDRPFAVGGDGGGCDAAEGGKVLSRHRAGKDSGGRLGDGERTQAREQKLFHGAQG